MITIRPFQNTDLGKVLELIKQSNSTNRSVDTWHGNNMTAILSFDGHKLIGAIPLEPRSFSLGGGNLLNILWVTGAYVKPEYRNQGIGSAMDKKIKEHFLPEFKAVFVYRSDEGSQAYRWYKKLGYHDLLPILSLKRDVKHALSTVKYTVLQTETEIQKWEGNLYSCFNKHVKAHGGFPQRHHQFWSHKLKTHYYKEFYVYSILILLHQNVLSGYAFLGQTDIKDKIKRIDILEMILPKNAHAKNNLYKAIMDYAYQHRLKEVRIQLSFQDPNLAWLKSLGFTNRWRTNIMGKFLEGEENTTNILKSLFSLNKWLHFHIDYI